MIGERQPALIELGIVRYEHAAFAGRDGLGAVKRKRPDPPHASGALSEIFGPDRLRGVLDHGNAMPAPDRKEAIHIAKITVEMHCKYRPGPGSDRAFDEIRIDAPPTSPNAATTRLRPHPNYR